MRKKINFNAISLIISILVICFTVSSYVFAVWQEPTAGPPGNNILPPINVSSTGQNKLGDFGIGGGSGQPVYWLSNYYGTLRFNSASPAGTRLVIGQDGNVGIGTTGPTMALTVAGQQLITSTAPELDWNKSNASANEGRWRIEGDTAKIMSFRAVNDAINDSTEWMRATRSSGITMSSVTFPNGNVGIGTASPDSNYRLTVAGGGVKAENSSAQPAGYFSSAGGGRAIQTGTGSILFANLAGAGSRMVIADASGVLSTQSVPSGINGGGADNYIPRWSGTSALENSVIYQTDTGNVGIGTTSPSTLLNTYSASVTNSLKVEGRASGSNAVSELWLASDTGANAKEFRIQAVGGSHGTQANKLTFYDQTAGAYRMVIDNSGNVGIGTTGPDNKFEVMGADSRSIRFDVNTNVDALRTVQLIFDNAENDATDALSVISSRLTNGSAGNATTDLAFEVSKLGTKSEAMRINSSGNVGIGTTGPGVALHVDAPSSITSTQYGIERLVARSTGVMANGFGGSIQLGIRDTDAVDNLVGYINWYRANGVDNSANIGFHTVNAGANTESLTLQYNGNV